MLAKGLFCQLRTYFEYVISTKNLKHISKLNYEYNIINYIRHGYEKSGGRYMIFICIKQTFVNKMSVTDISI